MNLFRRSSKERVVTVNKGKVTVRPELSIAGYQRGSSDIMGINWEHKDHLSNPQSR